MPTARGSIYDFDYLNDHVQVLLWNTGTGGLNVADRNLEETLSQAMILNNLVEVEYDATTHEIRSVRDTMQPGGPFTGSDGTHHVEHLYQDSDGTVHAILVDKAGNRMTARANYNAYCVLRVAQETGEWLDYVTPPSAPVGTEVELTRCKVNRAYE